MKKIMSGKIFLVIINRKKLMLPLLMILGICMLLMASSKNYVTSAVSHLFYDHIIVIDPGHGGIDGGTFQSGLLEKDINLDISLKVRKVLQHQNIKVILTRDKDISLEHKSSLNASRYKRDLDARKKIIDTSHASLFISIHTDSRPNNTEARGIGIFYYPTSGEGKELAQAIASSVNKMVYHHYLNTTDIKAEIAPGDYYILRETNIPGILIEVGFLTNPMDCKLLRREDYRNQVAWAIGDGIMNYLKTKEKDSVLSP